MTITAGAYLTKALAAEGIAAECWGRGGDAETAIIITLYNGGELWASNDDARVLYDLNEHTGWLVCYYPDGGDSDPDDVRTLYSSKSRDHVADTARAVQVIREFYSAHLSFDLRQVDVTTDALQRSYPAVVDRRERYKGCLVPRFAPETVREIAADLHGDPYEQQLLVVEDPFGGLPFRVLSLTDEDVEEIPPRDGLYPVGAWQWCWYEAGEEAQETPTRITPHAQITARTSLAIWLTRTRFPVPMDKLPTPAAHEETFRRLVLRGLRSLGMDVERVLQDANRALDADVAAYRAAYAKNPYRGKAIASYARAPEDIEAVTATLVLLGELSAEIYRDEPPTRSAATDTALAVEVVTGFAHLHKVLHPWADPMESLRRLAEYGDDDCAVCQDEDCGEVDAPADSYCTRPGCNLPHDAHADGEACEAFTLT
ncbi:hypothetical protein [Marinactinospora rubrisoli]|uniref:Uncharacterized protein n=1 Tax=Marinactinospora rubrisoli TaxID=2715399 RepID=A0ABW2KQ69_9ACTN